MSQLDKNTTTLNELLELAQNLPEAGTALPELENPGSAADLLVGKELIDGDGNVVTGSMPNKGAVSASLNTSTTSYTIPQGYHNGSGKVTISTETKTATPTKSTQNITPSSGKVLSKVTVNPIPAEYITTTDANAAATEILSGKTAYVNGTKVTGTMPNKGAAALTINPLSAESVTIPQGYHNGSGTASITADLKNRLNTINGNTGSTVAAAVTNVDTAVSNQASLISQIQTALEGKAAGGGGAAPETCTIRMYYDTSVPDTKLRKWQYAATIYENGVITTIADFNDEGTAHREVSINNVVCGSFVYIYGRAEIPMEGSGYTNLNYVDTYDNSYNYGHSIHARVTAPSGGEATFYIFDDD